MFTRYSLAWMTPSRDLHNTAVVDCAPSSASHAAFFVCTHRIPTRHFAATGSTWHAAGLTTYYHPGINPRKIHYYRCVAAVCLACVLPFPFACVRLLC